MWEIFLQTLPFFALIALGYGAGRTGFFTPEATAYLTKFVFYFALSAMLFRFSANLSLAEIFDLPFVLAYLWGTLFVYLIATAVALLRRRGVEEAAVVANQHTSLLLALADHLVGQGLREAADEAPFECEVGRLGGDEYLLVASGAESDDMTRFVEGLSFASRAPFVFDAATISTSRSRMAL